MIETELPPWGDGRFGVIHTPGTYSRVWRKVREERSYTQAGVTNIREVDTGKWEMIRA